MPIIACSWRCACRHADISPPCSGLVPMPHMSRIFTSISAGTARAATIAFASSDLIPQGHKLLRSRGVKRHRRVKVGLGRAHLDENGEDLRHLGSPLAQHMTANNLVREPIHYELH